MVIYMCVCVYLCMCIYMYVCVCVCVCVCALSHVWFFVTPWTIAHQPPLSMGFLKQEYWSGLPFPPPGDYPNPGMEPKSPVSLALAGRFFTTAPSGKPQRGRSGHYIPGAQLTKSTKLEVLSVPSCVYTDRVTSGLNCKIFAHIIS